METKQSIRTFFRIGFRGIFDSSWLSFRTYFLPATLLASPFYFLLSYLEHEVRNGKDGSDAIAMGGLFVVTILSTVIEAVFFTFWVLKSQKKTSLSTIDFFKSRVRDVTVEELRTLLPIILRFLLLVIPGIIESVRLYWVMYIAQYSKAYQMGEKDALEYSRVLVKNHWWATGLSVLCFSIVSFLPSGLGEFLATLLMGEAQANEISVFHEVIGLPFSVFGSFMLSSSLIAIFQYVLEKAGKDEFKI